MQSKKYSLIESISNVIIGYSVAILSQIIIFPFFDIHIPLSDNILIGLWFSLISICKTYLVRRLFVKLKNKFNVLKERSCLIRRGYGVNISRNYKKL